MKKSDLVHVTILVVAVLAGYNAVTNAITLLASVAYYFASVYRSTEVYMIFYLLQVVLYGGACILLVRNGREYADRMTQTEAEDFVEEAPRWDLDRRNMLCILFIGLGLYLAIQSLAVVAYAAPTLTNFIEKSISVRLDGGKQSG